MFGRKKYSDAQKKGRRAEFLARLYFRLCGYRILYKNYVSGRGTTAGEVDFIACRGKNLVFAEVKQRASLEEAAYALRPHQCRRIQNAALFFLGTYPDYRQYNVRFDVVLVKFPLGIRHIKNAWIP